MRRRRSPEIIGGRVNSDATIAAGENFAVQSVGTAAYKITCPPGFKVLSAVANPWVAASAFVTCTDFVDNSFYVRTYVWNTAATPGVCPFNFIAQGIQQ